MKYYSLDQLMEFVLPGLALTQTMYVAVRLGLADLLARGPMTADELAQATNTASFPLRRLLGAVETIGLAARDEQGRFRNTPNGEWFRSDHPASLRPALLVSLSPLFWKPLGALEESIRTGLPSFDGIFGQSFFDYLGEHPDDANRFADWMNATAVAMIPVILGAWDFSRYHTVVDVGGGRGALLAGILSWYPTLDGVLYDLPAVVSGAHSLQDLVSAGRCKIISGSFFDSVPRGGDAYILRAILHDWADKESITILRNCRRAVKPGTTLLVLESLHEDGTAMDLMDLHMLALMGGRTRTLAEHADLLRQGGFHIRQVVRAGLTIIESIAV